ncbi:MAG: TIGR02452 family protein, partial [Limisphaerales bacterium]
MARETVEICNSGIYTAPTGARVNIGSELGAAKAGTKVYKPQTTPRLAAKGATSLITVQNETAFAAIARLSARGDHVACLNFASAKNPGGGFLNGA